MEFHDVPPFVEYSISTLAMAPVYVQVIVCVVPSSQLSPPLGAVMVTVRSSAMVNTASLVSTVGPAVSLILTRQLPEGELGTVQL